MRTADMVESLIRQDVARYTPGLAAATALEALAACKQKSGAGAGADRALLRRCIEEATRPEEVVKDPRLSAP
jgi:hypothetical protein